jgi:hypothetical protein
LTWSQPEPSERSRNPEAAWAKDFMTNHRGIDPRDLPVKYPPDNQCQRCGRLPGAYRLTWDHDYWLERRGFSPVDSTRGWVCRRCFLDLRMMDENGKDDGSEYMTRLRDKLVLGADDGS